MSSLLYNIQYCVVKYNNIHYLTLSYNGVYLVGFTFLNIVICEIYIIQYIKVHILPAPCTIKYNTIYMIQRTAGVQTTVQYTQL